MDMLETFPRILGTKYQMSFRIKAYFYPKPIDLPNGLLQTSSGILMYAPFLKMVKWSAHPFSSRKYMTHPAMIFLYMIKAKIYIKKIYCCHMLAGATQPHSPSLTKFRRPTVSFPHTQLCKSITVLILFL